MSEVPTKSSRDILLSTAMELFATRGYDAVGVQEIVESVGLTKPTLYHWFGSKRGLLDAIFEENGSELCLIIAEAAHARTGLHPTLEGIALSLFRFAEAKRSFYRLFLSLWQAAPESEGCSAAADWKERLFDLVRELFRRSGIPKSRDTLLTASFLGALNYFIGFGLDGIPEFDEGGLSLVVEQFANSR